MPRVGVLAFQGSFAAHLAALGRLGAEAREVRTPEALAEVERLAIPGGESTTMSHHLERLGMGEEIRRRAQAGTLRLFGTCAGAILLGKAPSDEAATSPGRNPVRLGLADVVVRRNAYGRQLESFRAEVALRGPLEGPPLAGVWIRAPRFESLGPSVEVLGLLDGEPVIVRDGPCLLAAIHPELTGDDRVHRFFLGAG